MGQRNEVAEKNGDPVEEVCRYECILIYNQTFLVSVLYKSIQCVPVIYLCWIMETVVEVKFSRASFEWVGKNLRSMIFVVVVVRSQIQQT